VVFKHTHSFVFLTVKLKIRIYSKRKSGSKNTDHSCNHFSGNLPATAHKKALASANQGLDLLIHSNAGFRTGYFAE
jgi:hypothetical protein